MDKVFTLNCRFCNNDLIYKRLEKYGDVVFYCKANSCKHKNVYKTFTFLNVKKQIISKEIYLYSSQEETVSYKDNFNNFSYKQNNYKCLQINYEKKEVFLFESRWTDISSGGFNHRNLNLDPMKIKSIKDYNKLNEYISKYLMIE